MTKQSRSWKYLGIVLLAGILIVAAIVLWKFIDALLLGLALAYIVYPVAKRLNNGRTEKDTRWLIASLGAVLLIALPLIFTLFYVLNASLHWVIQNLPAITSGKFLVGLKSSLDSLGLGIVSDRIASESGKFISGFAESISTSVLNPTWLIEILLKVAIFFISAFYFVYEGPNIRALLDKYVPSKEKFLKELLLSFNKICYGLFVGHFFTSIIIAITAAIGFWLILQPSFINLAILTVLMFIVAFLPVIGPWFMYVPMGIWEIAFVPGGVTKGIALLAFGLIFLTLIPDFYIRPKLVQRGSEIHPLLLILGFFGGPLLFGLKGIIIGPLMLGLAQAIVTLYIEKRHILRDLIKHF